MIIYTNTVQNLPKAAYYAFSRPPYYARSFEVSGTLAYNNLSDHIKQQPSLNEYSTSLKIMLKDIC